MAIWDKEIKGLEGVGILHPARKMEVGKTSIRYNGKTYKRYKAGSSPRDKRYQKEEGDKKAFLCECGTEFGHYHYLGCDLEQCPICKGQLLSCGHGTLFETENVKCR